MDELPHPDADVLALPAVLFALSDPARLAIVRQLAGLPGAGASCQAVGGEMPKSTRSHHLKVLREAGVTRTRPSGRERLLTLRRDDLDARWPGLLAAVLADRPDGPDRPDHGGHADRPDHADRRAAAAPTA